MIGGLSNDARERLRALIDVSDYDRIPDPAWAEAFLDALDGVGLTLPPALRGIATVVAGSIVQEERPQLAGARDAHS